MSGLALGGRRGLEDGTSYFITVISREHGQVQRLLFSFTHYNQAHSFSPVLSSFSSCVAQSHEWLCDAQSRTMTINSPLQ